MSENYIITRTKSLAWALVPVLLAALVAALSSCSQATYPCPETGKQIVYNTTDNTATLKKATGARPDGTEPNKYDRNGLLKNKKAYTHKGIGQ